MNSTYSEKQVYRYLAVLLCVACVVSVVAIAEIPAGQRVTAPFQGEHGEPNTLASYLLFVMMLVVGMIVSADRRRLLFGGVSALMMVAFVYTLSRSAYLALVPALYVMLGVARKRLLILALTGLVLLGAAAPSLILPEAALQRVQSTFMERPSDSQAGLPDRLDLSTQARLSGAAQALGAFVERPILGWGVTGWRFIDSQYLKTLVETGMVGSVLFLYLICMVFLVGWRAAVYFRERNRVLFGLSAGFLGGTLGLLVCSVGTNVFIIVRIMEPFWLVCALLVVAPRLARLQDSPVPAVPGGVPA